MSNGQGTGVRAIEVAGIGITVATALSYAFGYLCATTAAAQLGVAPADFAFTFPDYVFIAAWYYLIVGLAVVAFFAQQWLIDHRPQGGGSAGFAARGTYVVAGIAMATVYIIVASVISRATGLSVLIVYPVVFFGVLAEPVLRRSPRAGSVIVLIAIVAAGLLAVRAGEEWAKDVRRYAAGNASVPDSQLTPGGYLNPTVGHACSNGECFCVVRVGTHILVGTRSVSVVDVIQSFTPGNCHVSAHPTFRSTGPTRVTP